MDSKVFKKNKVKNSYTFTDFFFGLPDGSVMGMY